MPHDHHGHHHSHTSLEAGDSRVAWAVVVNIGLTVAQLIGGVLSGSLALIADALHNFSDAISLIVAYLARKIARRPADERMSFGYGRAEVVAALVNYTTLVVVALYLMYEGVMRFFNPEPIDGWMVVWIAMIALVIDLVTAALTFSMSKDSMNIRAAFLHNVADALGSVGVIIAGAVVIIYGWVWVDPAITIMISLYILWHVKSEISDVVRVLMLGSPPDLEFEDVAQAIEAVGQVESVHHMHLWTMQERISAVDAHLVIARGAWGDADQIKADVKQVLAETFGISHSTLEMECARHACVGATRIGHE